MTHLEDAVDEVIEGVEGEPPREEVRESLENLLAYHIPTDEAILSLKKKYGGSKGFSIPEPE